MLGDDIEAALPELRAHAESMMRDQVLVERPTGTTLDPDTLAEVPSYAPVWTGPGRVQRTDMQVQQITLGDLEHTLADVLLQLPIPGTHVIRPGDRVTVTAAANDQALAGARMTVRKDLTKTHATMRRLACQESS